MPERCIQSTKNREDNIAFEMSWDLTEQYDPYISYATDIYTSSNYTSSLLTSNEELHYWGAFPTVRGWTFPRFLDKEIDYNVARSCNCDNAVAYIDTSGSLWIWGLITSIA